MRVVELDESARALLAETRDAYEPTAANRAQVRWQVERRLAAGSRPLGERRRRHVVLGGLAIAALSLAGGAAALGWRETPIDEVPETPLETTRTDGPQAVRAAASPVASAAREVVEEPSPTPSTRASALKRAGAPRSSTPSLDAEVALIARAQAATNRGQAEEALRALQEYDRAHQSGALVEERSAARILALCAAGRDSDARAATASFLQKWPRSPQVARIRSSCGSQAREPAPR